VQEHRPFEVRVEHREAQKR
jgi:hypothetical protein